MSGQFNFLENYMIDPLKKAIIISKFVNNFYRENTGIKKVEISAYHIFYGKLKMILKNGVCIRYC